MRSKRLPLALALCTTLWIVSAHALPPIEEWEKKDWRFCGTLTSETGPRSEIVGCNVEPAKRVTVPVLSNKDLAEGTNGNVTKAVITIHGSGGNPAPLYKAVRANIDDANTWLIAPTFADEPGKSADVLPDVLYWVNSGESNVGQSIGDPSVLPKYLNAQTQQYEYVRLSSFDVLDQLIRKLRVWAPNIQEFVIIGFSGGGRLLNRYSLGTKIGDSTFTSPSASLRYVIASGSNYLYMSPTRYVRAPGEDPPYAVKDDIAQSDCPVEYDYYSYGLGGLSVDSPAPGHYMYGITKTQFKARAQSRSRLFLVGSFDKETGGGLDTSCPGLQQGANRYDRAELHWHHLRTEQRKGQPLAKNAYFCFVPGTDLQHPHDGQEMAGSEAATQYWKFGNVDGVDHCSDYTGIPTAP